MDAATVINLTYVGAALAAGIGVLWLSGPRRPSLAKRVAAARTRAGLGAPEWEYDGPDSLRLLQDLEAHMKAYGAAVADFYDTTPGGPTS